ncbi:MAG: LamG domain-containing protein, partial [Armatimonadota bacterium]|nr:LamG domain-containing protein [Armatimonadota bacterium]
CYHDLTPKPAYFAHRTCALLLEGAVPDGIPNVGSRALARRFRRGTERIVALWCPEGPATVLLRTGRSRPRQVDLMGNERPLPTVEGVATLRADENLSFVRGLNAQAAGVGALVEMPRAVVARGSHTLLSLKVRNPFPTSRTARVRVRAPAGLVLAPGEGAIRLPANGAGVFQTKVSAHRETPMGWHLLEVRAQLPGLSAGDLVRLGVSGAPKDAGPVGYWKLDEGRGTHFFDSSGRGNHGTVEAPEWVPGVGGTALRFTGQPPAVVPAVPSLDLRDAVTLAFWLKVEKDTGTWQFPVTRFFGGDVLRNYGVYLNPGTLAPCFSASFERGSTRHTDFASNAPLEAGVWHHVAASYSMLDERVRLYVDGEMKVDGVFSGGAMRTTTDPLRLGQGTWGVLDEVRIYPRALAPAEVHALARERP